MGSVTNDDKNADVLATSLHQKIALVESCITVLQKSHFFGFCLIPITVNTLEIVRSKLGIGYACTDCMGTEFQNCNFYKA